MSQPSKSKASGVESLDLKKILNKAQLEGLKRELKEQLYADLQEEATSEMYKVAKALMPQLVEELKPAILLQCQEVLSKKLKRMHLEIKFPNY